MWTGPSNHWEFYFQLKNEVARIGLTSPASKEPVKIHKRVAYEIPGIKLWTTMISDKQKQDEVSPIYAAVCRLLSFQNGKGRRIEAKLSGLPDLRNGAESPAKPRWLEFIGLSTWEERAAMKMPIKYSGRILISTGLWENKSWV